MEILEYTIRAPNYDILSHEFVLQAPMQAV